MWELERAKRLKCVLEVGDEDFTVRRSEGRREKSKYVKTSRPDLRTISGLFFGAKF